MRPGSRSPTGSARSCARAWANGSDTSGSRTYSDYYELVRADASGEERRELVNCITTNLTSFYREAHHFEFLRREVAAMVAVPPRAAPEAAPPVERWLLHG